jgi:hypothetical protein
MIAKDRGEVGPITRTYALIFSVMVPLLLAGCGTKLTPSRPHKVEPVVVPQSQPPQRVEQQRERKELKVAQKMIKKEIPAPDTQVTTERSETIGQFAKALATKFIGSLQAKVKENQSESVDHHIYILGAHEKDDDPVDSCVIAKALVPKVEASYTNQKAQLKERRRQGLGDILIDPTTLEKYLQRTDSIERPDSSYQPTTTTELQSEKVRWEFRAIASSDRSVYEVSFYALDEKGGKIDITQKRIQADSFFGRYRQICKGMFKPPTITEVTVMTPKWEGSVIRYNQPWTGSSYMGGYLLKLKVDQFERANSRLIGLANSGNGVQRLLPLYPTDRGKAGCEQVPDGLLQGALQNALVKSRELLYPDQKWPKEKDVRPLTTYGNERLHFYLVNAANSEQLSALDVQLASMNPSLCSSVSPHRANNSVEAFEYFLKDNGLSSEGGKAIQF